MKCGRGQAAERGGKALGSNPPQVLERPTQHLLGEQRAGSDCRDAAARLKPDSDNAPLFDARGQAQHIAADRVRYFHDGRGIFKLSGIARILEMVEHNRAVHRAQYGSRPPGMQSAQRRAAGKTTC